jgi:isoamylase
VALNQPDWSQHSHALAVTLESLHGRFLFHVIFNAYWEALTFELPPTAEGQQPWRRCIDTALPSPDDIRTLDEAPAIAANSYVATPRSVVLLVRALAAAADA